MSSYFRSAQENLLPKYDKIIGQDYHIVHVPMSNFQFNIYETARRKERKSEKVKPTQSIINPTSVSMQFKRKVEPNTNTLFKMNIQSNTNIK